jgi:hypothetical protein
MHDLLAEVTRMIPSQIREILEGLLRKSDAGGVKWVNSQSVGMEPVMEEDYLVALPDSSINVYKLPDDELRLNILNSEGDVVLSVGTSDTPDSKDLLQKLLHSARNSVLNVEGTLASIQKALRSDDVIGGARPTLKNNPESSF